MYSITSRLDVLESVNEREEHSEKKSGSICIPYHEE